jgi:hypothetical protein
MTNAAEETSQGKEGVIFRSRMTNKGLPMLSAIRSSSL